MRGATEPERPNEHAAARAARSALVGLLHEHLLEMNDGVKTLHLLDRLLDPLPHASTDSFPDIDRGELSAALRLIHQSLADRVAAMERLLAHEAAALKAPVLDHS